MADTALRLVLLFAFPKKNNNTHTQNETVFFSFGKNTFIFIFFGWVLCVCRVWMPLCFRYIYSLFLFVPFVSYILCVCVCFWLLRFIYSLVAAATFLFGLLSVFGIAFDFAGFDHMNVVYEYVLFIRGAICISNLNKREKRRTNITLHNLHAAKQQICLICCTRNTSGRPIHDYCISMPSFQFVAFAFFFVLPFLLCVFFSSS